ncbi:hypothetical protein RB195_018077 [Necator americanus]|uniref:Uncharacterized protein n=1 Tax=Necator americanus TaxID=51031 RepID=A0ABR1C830_NECAM
MSSQYPPRQVCYQFINPGGKKDLVFCLTQPQNSYSQSDTLVVIYRGTSGSSFTLKYRYDPPDVVVTTPITTSSTTTTTSSTTTTTTRTTPSTTTSTQPITVGTPSSSGCTPWSECSAPCGGCGVYSRTCNGVVERSYCNKNPCKFNFCCRPFLYVNQGFCFHPYSDDHIIKNAEKGTKAFFYDRVGENIATEGSGEVIP